MKRLKPIPVEMQCAIQKVFTYSHAEPLKTVLEVLTAAEVYTKAAWWLSRLERQRRQGLHDEGTAAALTGALKQARSIATRVVGQRGVHLTEREIEQVLMAIRAIAIEPIRCYLEFCDELPSNELEALMERWQEVLSARRS